MATGFRSRGIAALLITAACSPDDASTYTLWLERRPGLVALPGECDGLPVARYLTPRKFLSEYPSRAVSGDFSRLVEEGYIFMDWRRHARIGRYRLSRYFIQDHSGIHPVESVDPSRVVIKNVRLDFVRE